MKRLKEILSPIFKRVKADIVNIKYIALIIVIYLVVIRTVFKAVCPMVIITGLPCPGCGMTRSLISFLQFRFKESFVYNPCLIVWLFLVAYWGFCRYFAGRKPRYFTVAAVMTGLITIVVYIIRMALMFPSEPPLTYMYDNFLARIFSGYSEYIQSLF